MAKRSKAKAQLAAELKQLKQVRSTESWVSVINNIAKWGGIVLIARYAFLAIEVLSGQITLADIGVNFLGKVEVTLALSWIAAIGGGVYGTKQKKLRKDTIERLQSRIKSLEVQLDSRRSSSNLTPRGDTRPEDHL